MWIYSLVFSLLGLLDLGSAQLVQFGQCNQNIQLVENFNATQFSGKWFGIARTNSQLQSADCSTLELMPSGNGYSVVNDGVNNNFLERIEGNATLEAGTAKFTLNLNNVNQSVDFWILSTDYNNFALAYACETVSTTQRRVYIWQLGRATEFPNQLMPVLMNQTLHNLLGITVDNLNPIEHSERACYVLPNIPPGESIILSGQCDTNLTVQQNFSAERFTGTWHGIASYFTAEQRGVCERSQYTLNGTVVNVINSEIINQTLRAITGTAVVASTDGSAKLRVNLEVAPGVFSDADLWVLATDYDNYAVSYNCVNLPNNQRRVISWIIGRTRRLSEATQRAIDQVIDSYMDLNQRFFIASDQSDESCFYFPDPEPSRPVVFRGQCDQTIPVVQNFNATAYLGLWHNIEAYPSVWEVGTCINARYSLGDGVVNVLNSQVRDQALATMAGFAQVVSTDGSAKLEVTFPIPGINQTVSISYWVLDTDYTSYAFVYTCQNLGPDDMQVWSWKLSRAKALTIAANSAINRVIDTVRVLDARYYVERNQSDAGCFYFPEPRPGVPVVFPGRCDATVSVVSNFNLTSFQGIWYEYQAYPKQQQTGQCVFHNYTAGTGNTLNIVSSSVTDQFVGLTDGSLAFTSTDGSGRLTLTVRTTAGDVSFPFWILAVDYADYAFAYSCVELEDDHRAIYSWKLSRTKGALSAAANTAINNIINTNVVLEQRYFEDIDQSEDACYTLPDLPLGVPVVIPGQCDPNITVVQNFNTSRFTGVWRLVETYFSEFQSGNCNEATYTLNGTDLIVFNSHVINQTLNSITGLATVASDGSGKLVVTFPNRPGQSDYWILDTDYDSYALAYSCVNLNAQEKRVWSWKLSRTNELSQTAQTNINRVVNSVQVLNDRYYQRVDRSDAACFYFPEPDTVGPIVFRGQCDESIPVVTNFNTDRYMGLWYNTESYPTPFQGGTCNNAHYTLVGNEIDVYNTQVVNQSLSTINGVARFVPSTDGSAKLITSFFFAGTNVTREAPYWVLGTDYDTYALVYTCVNVDIYHRQVYSWKLSRTKELTTNANNLINSIVANIPVLNQQYFVDRNQTAEGCFYFPEPRPGVVVEFPGQCDNTIQAVPNFNLTAFLGTWHEIEAYPKEQQTGQCVNHDYSPGTNNTLNLESTSVSNLVLNVTNSTVAITSTDGSGRLTITITTGNTVVNIPFWVIATDYTDYALAYSCVNVQSDFRRVFSWKLSRTRQLSAAANVAINARMTDIVVLENRYFETIDQSDDACFYLPERVGQVPIVFRGLCDPNIPVVQNFNISRYTGTWRLVESYPHRFQTGTCIDATYTLNGTDIIVYNTQVVNQTLGSITGSAVLATVDGSGKLNVTLRGAAVRDYWILDTDYDSYALVYGCRNRGSDSRSIASWKLSRTDTLSATANANINRIVDSINVLDDRYYDPVDQSAEGCFYLPQPSLTAPPTFRGQCNESIPVVTNFNTARYMGLWYNTESYPTPFQGGTCNNAYYTLVGNEIDVYNTQVVNQSLSTINGVARFVPSTDGSAKLIVSFFFAGTNQTRESPYWVLATDYDSYALVYTCVNLPDNRQQVFSWKLSRTKQLTDNANNAINSVVADIPVLNQQYFIDRNQTAEGCFYFPEPRPGVVVEFPGQCDNTIQAFPNFNLTAFIGIWHEIEAYPKAQQTGQCINHQYSQGSGNTLNLVSSSVIDQELNVTNSNVAITSTDGSGRLSIVLSSNGTTISIPFWILDTDYTTYALAYSCANSRTDFRSVYSWKLSRTKQLTPAAVAAINTAIEPINVLDNRYYERIDQSDDACFYLPNLGPNDPVVFRGQCDPNIPVVRDFNLTRYANRWRLIETYQADPQRGACNQATYSLLPNNTVLVTNTQVFNEVLQSIEGTAVLATTDGSGKLLVTFPNIPEPAELWILDTDYDSYALLYSCRNLNSEQRRVYSWKLSRTRELSTTAVTNINRVVNSINVLNSRYYQSVDQSDEACFYFPVPDGNPVTFRGQCNDSIPVVTNFDAQRYMGKWYDIQSYPQRFQDGTCPTANYSLSGRGVEVLNTQVVGQQLDTINGVAVPAANDGSAKLIVSFPVAGTDLVRNMPYWVLTTDYDSYALVYSCTNLDEETRRVSSWQLSRTKNLTANAVTEFNRVMETVPVLRQEYFNLRGHSDDDCFYYPDNQGGPVVLDGQCVDQDVVANFWPADFAGTWYETARFPSDLQSGECVANSLTLSGNTLTLTATIVYNERLVTVSGTATPSADGRGILTARLTGGGVTIEKTIYILSTDYNDHALLFSCSNLNSYSKQIYSWKLARSQGGFSAASNATINAIVSRNVDLFEGYYETTDQGNDGCFYYPVFPEPPTNITLPGPCDERIRGKPNFNAGLYLGRWFEIASYPQAFQFGECSRAEYIADGGVVRVVNSQVFNQRLDIMIGSAVVASTDGSGVLNVTFAFDNGVVNVANYYILETDYSSFALVYSCRNVANNRRQVTSWKLSRTKSLSSEANAVIDRVIGETQGLLGEYYTPTRQDEDACFYIPEINRDEAPRFRGQCGNVTGVQNFNAQRYIGWWHEIEHYPSDHAVGECISSDFRASGNQFQIVDTNVFGLAAQVNTSTVVVSNDGRLRKTYSDGRVEDVWVLATDYETYSLLYSCENIDDEYMRVWSAKHSKTRSLSDAAQNAIAQVINNNRLLVSDFYLPVNQSDEACFHYPEQTGRRIILPGQCDPNIPVVQSFNAGDYTGTWFQIERYPQPFETGNCTGARYTLNSNTGVISVTNWQVIDGVLDVIEGTANVTSTDGSARLRVRLPVRRTDDPVPPMVEMDLWVLATDYTTYSLVYSCSNLDEFTRSVGAWKLSRTRTMPDSGNTAINNYMAARQELHQPLFIQVGQSDNCEQPSSGMLVRSSIIFIVVCAVFQLLL